MSDAPVPAPAAPKQALSLTGFILGLAAFLFSWILGLGFLVALAAIILSLVGKAKEPGAPKWMWIVGLIGGILGLLGSILWGFLFVLPFIIAGASGGFPIYQY